MSMLGGFLGRKSGSSGTPVQTIETPAGEPDDLPLHPEPQNDTTIDSELFSPLAVQLGEENEAVRNLLIDVGTRMKDLDTVRDAFRRLVGPVSKTLRAYEEEKSEKAGLQAVLNETRASYNRTRSDLAAAEKKTAALENELRGLQDNFANAQQTVSQLEAARTEQAMEITTRKSQLAEIERELAQLKTSNEMLRDENLRFGERLAANDKRIVQLESELETARQRALLAEQEKDALQTSFEQASAEATRLARKIIEAENALSESQARLRQTEHNLSEAAGERSRLAIALEEANERHKGEIAGVRARFEALQSRAATTEKLLDEARGNMLTQAEQIRNLERYSTEAGIANNGLANRVTELQGAQAERDAQIAELEKSRAALVERNALLTRTIKAREGALARADEQLALLNERVLQFEAEVNATRASAEQKIEELNAALQRERTERSVAEGALESGRKDLARLLREIAALKGKDVADDVAQRLTNAA